MLNLYDRPTGVICLESDVFYHAQDITLLLNAMLSCGLEWHWRSSRRFPSQAAFAAWNLPACRDYTRLNEGSLPLLRMELLERDQNDDQRSLDVLGADGDLSPTLRDAEATEQLLAAFVREEPPLRLVLLQLGDTGTCHLFLPHRPTATVTALLGAWSIDLVRVDKRWQYRRLRIACLESIFRLEVVS